jgi:hypothetical protein
MQVSKVQIIAPKRKSRSHLYGCQLAVFRFEVVATLPESRAISCSICQTVKKRGCPRLAELAALPE